MILILSYKSYEQGTDPVIEWLVYHNYPFKKVVLDDLLNYDVFLDSESKEVIIDGINISKKVNIIFYRRFKCATPITIEGPNLGYINRKITSESNNELSSLIDYMFYLLKDKYWMPFYNVISLNKEIVLREAFNVGLLVPRSILTNSKKVLNKFKKLANRVIYKPIEVLSYYNIGPYTYSSYTTEITNTIKKDIPEKFFPSLFQELIEAEYEIRTFYLDGTFFSSAVIRSQFTKKHNVDIKLDFNKVETDWTCYELPVEIKQKVNTLMKRLNLNTGSIDIIKSVDGNFYFIEVNPVGQYLAQSFICNYHLEKYIAEWLIQKDRSLNQ